MVLVIGISGKLGCGKDYVAKRMLVPRLQSLDAYLRPLYLAFADPLKAECSARYGTSYEVLYGEKDEITRKRLQEIGDELRKKFGEQYFVRWMRLQFKLHEKRSDINLFVITDVRFPEEVKLIHEMGGKVYRVQAPERNKQRLRKECENDDAKMKARASHRSETLLDECKEFDGYIRNDPKDHPEEDMKQLIRRLLADATPKNVLSIDMQTLLV